MQKKSAESALFFMILSMMDAVPKRTRLTRRLLCRPYLRWRGNPAGILYRTLASGRLVSLGNLGFIGVDRAVIQQQEAPLLHGATLIILCFHHFL